MWKVPCGLGMGLAHQYYLCRHLQLVRFSIPLPGTPMSDDSLATIAGVHRAVQLDILKLLSLGVGRPSPNIAHYLLGFRVGAGKHISDTTLQDPGELVVAKLLA